MPQLEDRFKEFVERALSKENAFEPPPELASRVGDWTKALKGFYDQVEEFLGDQIKADAVRITYRDMELNENYLGSYSVPKMLIQIGSHHVSLVPVGTLVIGAKGRVDVIGSVGKARVVLMDKSAVDPKDLIKVSVDDGDGKSPQAEMKKLPELEWKIATNPPAVRFVSLDKETFLGMLLEVSDA